MERKREEINSYEDSLFSAGAGGVALAVGGAILTYGKKALDVAKKSRVDMFQRKPTSSKLITAAYSKYIYCIKYIIWGYDCDTIL